MAAGDFYGSVYSTAKSLGATDVQAHLAAAQASNETGFGKHVFANNYFGIKASPSYTGASDVAATSEEYGGVTASENANFRAYQGLEQSVKDYMGMMAQNFPDAWNAPTVEAATKELDNGTFGKYATKTGYSKDIAKIADKYGAQAEADQTPSSVPTPEARPTAALNGFDSLANPGMPTPDLQKNGLLSALFSSEPATASPFDAVLNKQVPVTASGLLAGAPDLSASVTADPSTAPSVEDRFGQRPPQFNDYATMAANPMPGTFDPNRFAPQIDPTTNTQSFLNAPVADPAQNSFAALAAAGPVATGINAPMDGPAVGNTNVASGLLGNVQPTSVMSRFGSPNPAFNDYQAMANAGPMAAPVQASATMGPMAQPDLAATATASPFSNSFANLAAAGPMAAPVQASATGLLGTTPDLSANAGLGISVATPDTMAARFGPSIDMSTNTKSFLGDPSVVSAPSVAAPTSGLLSGVGSYGTLNDITNQINTGVTNAVAAPNYNQAFSPNIPSLSSPTYTGTALGTNSGLVAPSIDSNKYNDALSGMPTGLLSGYQATPSQTPAEQAIGGLVSTSANPNDAIGNQSMFSQAMAPSVPSLSVPDVSVEGTAPSAAYQGLVSQSFPASIPSIEAAQSYPSLTTQPSTTIAGPATTSAVDQQQEASTGVTGAAAKKGLLGGLINKGTLTGGLLGSLVGGPVGGLLGGFIGNKVNANGGLTGLLGNSSMPQGPNIGGGLANVASVYGGLVSPGTSALTSNGGLVTALGNGMTAYTNSYGVTNTIDKNGTQYGTFGSFFNGDKKTAGTSGPGGTPGGVSGAAY